MHGIQVESIITPGTKHIIIQKCIPEMDSIISNGNVSFNHSIVGKIQDCTFEYQIRQDTLKTIVIRTFKKINTEQAIEQLNFQYGLSNRSFQDKKEIFKWEKEIETKNILTATMTTNKCHKKSTLIITIKK